METFKSNFTVFKLSQEFGFRSGKCTSVNLTSFDISCHLSLPFFGVNNKFIQLVDLKISCGCIQAIKQEKVYIWEQLKLTDIAKFCHLK